MLRPAVAAVLVAIMTPMAWAHPPTSQAGDDKPGARDAGPGKGTASGDRSKDARARTQQSEWKKRFGTTVYRYVEDEKHRLVFATCLDETSHAEMQRMLAAQADQQAATLFGAVPEVEVFVAIARPADAKAVIGGNTTTEGMYEHPMRRLVASDIGIVLRHEFTHLMHFGHMERLGQPHMLWVQEGLACLYESYALDQDGAIVFEPNLRHNQARSLASSRTYTPLATLVRMTPDEFMAKSQPLYPQVRSLFEYMADTGKLRRFYQRYTETFDQDRTGAKALEETMGKPLASIETDWRAWVLKRPAVDISPRANDRDIGVEIVGATDGVRVQKVGRKSAAARAGVRVGDVVVAVAGTPVRSPREFSAALASVRDSKATITLRRGGERLELQVEFSQANQGARAGVGTNVEPRAGSWPDNPRPFLPSGQFGSNS